MAFNTYLWEEVPVGWVLLFKTVDVDASSISKEVVTHLQKSLQVDCSMYQLPPEAESRHMSMYYMSSLV